jgi:hypothetical protein
MDRDKNWNLIGAFSGVVFVVLIVAGMAIAGDPGVEPTDSSDAIARAFADRSDDAELGSFISLIGTLFFFPFLAYFCNRLRSAKGVEDGGGWLISAAYGGGLVTAAMSLVLLTIGMASTSVGAGVEPLVAKVLLILMWNFTLAFGPPMIALTLGSSLVIVRYSALPKWIGWLGFAVSVTLLMPWIGMFVAFFWILIVSLVMTYQAWGSSADQEAVPQA